MQGFLNFSFTEYITKLTLATAKFFDSLKKIGSALICRNYDTDNNELILTNNNPNNQISSVNNYGNITSSRSQNTNQNDNNKYTNSHK